VLAATGLILSADLLLNRVMSFWNTTWLYTRHAIFVEVMIVSLFDASSAYLAARRWAASVAPSSARLDQ